MNASSPGVVFMHFIHLLLFFVRQLLEYKMHFGFIVSSESFINYMYSNLWMLPPQVFVVFMHFIHLLLFFVRQLLEYKMHFGFIVSCNK